MPPAAAEGDVDLTSGDWTSDLASQLRRTADAWSDPAAWDGVTPLGGQDSPAPLIGGMVLVEFEQADSLAGHCGPTSAFDVEARSDDG
jgi:hypothetical protein